MTNPIKLRKTHTPLRTQHTETGAEAPGQGPTAVRPQLLCLLANPGTFVKASGQGWFSRAWVRSRYPAPPVNEPTPCESGTRPPVSGRPQPPWINPWEIELCRNARHTSVHRGRVNKQRGKSGQFISAPRWPINVTFYYLNTQSRPTSEQRVKLCGQMARNSAVPSIKLAQGMDYNAKTQRAVLTSGHDATHASPGGQQTNRRCYSQFAEAE